MSEEPSRITVSRDALRADLAEMELRLRTYFDSQMIHKAEAAFVVDLSHKIDALDRGDFTPVHRRALEEFIEGVLAVQTDRSWTRRERSMAALSAVIAAATFVLSIVLALHGIGF